MYYLFYFDLMLVTKNNQAFYYDNVHILDGFKTLSLGTTARYFSN